MSGVLYLGLPRWTAQFTAAVNQYSCDTVNANYVINTSRDCSQKCQKFDLGWENFPELYHCTFSLLVTFLFLDRDELWNQPIDLIQKQSENQNNCLTLLDFKIIVWGSTYAFQWAKFSKCVGMIGSNNFTRRCWNMTPITWFLSDNKLVLKSLSLIIPSISITVCPF